MRNLFFARVIRSNKVVAFTEDGWISTSTDRVHLPFVVSVVCYMRIPSPYPAMSSISYPRQNILISFCYTYY